MAMAKAIFASYLHLLVSIFQQQCGKLAIDYSCSGHDVVRHHEKIQMNDAWLDYFTIQWFNLVIH